MIGELEHGSPVRWLFRRRATSGEASIAASGSYKGVHTFVVTFTGATDMRQIVAAGFRRKLFP